MTLARLIVCLLSLLTAILPAATTGAAVDPAKPPLVLILNSYHHDYTWSDREVAGILDSFDKSGFKADIRVEFMDSKNYPHNEHFSQLRDLFVVKYGNRKPALVMPLDNPAFEFAIKYRQELFREVPIVFAGLNDYEPGMLKGESGITGIVERQDIAGTIRLARQLQPDLKEVVILHDFTSSGLASRKEAEEQLTTLDADLRINFLPDMTIDEIVTRLKGLKPGTIVLPFSYSRDKAGKVFTHAQLTEILGKNSAVPVYGTKEERLGHGIVGGSLLEGKSHGGLAAGLALRILRGESAAAIPIITEPACRIMFDHAQLQRFAIHKSRLPPDSIVINRPPGFYQEHALVINLAGLIILLLALSLVAVIIADRRRIRAEVRQVEAERSRNEVLAAANREMESFCYAVSHDLQAPLRHIKAYCRIIDEDYRSGVDATLDGYLKRINGAAGRMSRLISDLLMLSRVAMAEISEQEFDLGELAKEVFASLQQQEWVRPIEFTAASGLRVVADRTLLRTVVEHLLDNACKFSAAQVAPKVHLGSKIDAGRQVFYLSDNGAGFDEQYAEKLFAPFQRLHPDEEFRGNGIGLAIVQRIIHRHGGQIWAESRPGAGSTFYFTLGS